MSLAVGGSYAKIGKLQAELLIHFGLKDGMRLADVGCGSGRTATALSERISIEYDGFDIVQTLLDYAASKAPPNYLFNLNRGLTLPSPDNSYDMICGFSLFTHLLHEETFIYLRDMLRVLKPGGMLAFSFLEFGCRPTGRCSRRRSGRRKTLPSRHSQHVHRAERDQCYGRQARLQGRRLRRRRDRAGANRSTRPVDSDHAETNQRRCILHAGRNSCGSCC